MGGSGGIHQAFGLRLRSSFRLPELPRIAAGGPVDVAMTAAPAEVVDDAFSGPAEPRAVHAAHLGDGSSYRTERGRAGDVRIDYGRRAVAAASPPATAGAGACDGDQQIASFHLTASGRELRCWAAYPAGLSWRRFLLDTVLATVALERGFEALHAGAFERDGEAVAVVAAQGGGKSTLLAELLRLGRPLFCDDVLSLARGNGLPVAHPGPPLMNLASTLPGGASSEHVGRVLGLVDGESWVAIERASTHARPLGAVVFLVRRGHRPVAAHRVPPNPVPLLSHSLPSGREPARLDKRFALFADVAANVPLVRLRVPVDLPAARIAATLERVLDRACARGSAA